MGTGVADCRGDPPGDKGGGGFAETERNFCGRGERAENTMVLIFNPSGVH